jgi:hypothetical protein
MSYKRLFIRLAVFVPIWVAIAFVGRDVIGIEDFGFIMLWGYLATVVSQGVAVWVTGGKL